ncbi:MAG TPA: sigma-70 family RNA polymerase sigma factor [Candidatus Solibacter sp.]|nr:sigma-70 family RNA polymerase sigma factor [Candidatus Solibacter sp.]
MTDTTLLAQQFEAHRGHLRGVAYRMLGSASEADDAIQETWLRLTSASAGGIQNLRGWLTTVIARICLDMLRARTSRREEPIEAEKPAPEPSARQTIDPEQEAMLADSVGIALLVMIDQLSPAERLAFVLHDMFDVSFDEIAGIIGRTPDAARQLASRARRRVRGAQAPDPQLAGQRKVVDAFLTALRQGDFEGLLAVLDPDVVVRVAAGAGRSAVATEIHGARTWAKGAIAFSRTVADAQPAIAIVDGKIGLVVARSGHLFRALQFTIVGDKIVSVDIVASATQVQALDV